MGVFFLKEDKFIRPVHELLRRYTILGRCCPRGGVLESGLVFLFCCFLHCAGEFFQLSQPLYAFGNACSAKTTIEEAFTEHARSSGPPGGSECDWLAGSGGGRGVEEVDVEPPAAAAGVGVDGAELSSSREDGLQDGQRYDRDRNAKLKVADDHVPVAAVEDSTSGGALALEGAEADLLRENAGKALQSLFVFDERESRRSRHYARAWHVRLRGWLHLLLHKVEQLIEEADGRGPQAGQEFRNRLRADLVELAQAEQLRWGVVTACFFLVCLCKALLLITSSKLVKAAQAERRAAAISLGAACSRLVPVGPRLGGTLRRDSKSKTQLRTRARQELREKHGLTVQYAKSSGTYTTSLGNLRKSPSARSALEAYLTKAIADAASDPGSAAAARAVGARAGGAPDDMSGAAASGGPGVLEINPVDVPNGAQQAVQDAAADTAKLPHVVVGERVNLDAGIEERRAFLAQLRREYAGHSALRGGEMNEGDDDEDAGDDEDDSDELSQQSDDSDTEVAQLGGGSAARGGGGPRAGKRKMAGTLPKVAEELQEHGDQKAAQQEEDWEDSMKNRNWVRVQIHQVPFLVRLNMPLVSLMSTEEKKSSDGVPLAVCAAFFSQKRPTDVEADRELLSRLSQAESTRNFAILILRSGRFSGAIFSSVDGRCLLHKTFRRYTVRAKAGGAQSTKDNTGKSIKSAGSTLRRYGEQQLENSMKTLFRDWEGDLRQCKGDVFVSGGHDQIATLLKCLPGESPAYKKLPIQVRKSTLEEVETLALQLRTVHFFPEQMEKKLRVGRNASGGAAPASIAPGPMKAVALSPRSRAATGSTKASKQELRSTAPDRRLNQHLLQGTNQESDPRNQQAEEEEQAYLSDEVTLTTRPL
eukprot:g15720.t1